MPHLARDEGVRSVILQRLAGISRSCREWLEGGSVCGREFSATIAAEAVGLDPGALSEVLAEAGGARLIALEEDAPDRCCFDHSLIQEVIREALTPDARARLQAGVASVLERHSRDDQRPPQDGPAPFQAKPV
jgi:hypothetical protein